MLSVLQHWSIVDHTDPAFTFVLPLKMNNFMILKQIFLIINRLKCWTDGSLHSKKVLVVLKHPQLITNIFPLQKHQMKLKSKLMWWQWCRREVSSSVPAALSSCCFCAAASRPVASAARLNVTFPPPPLISRTSVFRAAALKRLTAAERATLLLLLVDTGDVVKW